MIDTEMRTMGACLLEEARAIRAAYPDASALRDLPIGPLRPDAGGRAESAALRVALGGLRDEMLLVRAGRAGSLTVLDDEIACAERALAGL